MKSFYKSSGHVFSDFLLFWLLISWKMCILAVSAKRAHSQQRGQAPSTSFDLMESRIASDTLGSFRDCHTTRVCHQSVCLVLWIYLCVPCRDTLIGDESVHNGFRNIEHAADVSFCDVGHWQLGHSPRHFTRTGTCKLQRCFILLKSSPRKSSLRVWVWSGIQESVHTEPSKHCQVYEGVRLEIDKKPLQWEMF